MIFVFPMAGESNRFAEAGYLQPKFRLSIHGAPLFDHVVGSFDHYFPDDAFLFIARDRDGAQFARERCAKLGMKKPLFVALGAPTSGQAETVFRGLEMSNVADEEAITIFNIDTIRPRYRKPVGVFNTCLAGYLEVFRGEGDGWSFVMPDPVAKSQALCVAEKLRLSEFCCTGLYHFRRAEDFRWAYRNPPPPRSAAEQCERYVAPLYNALITRGTRIGMEVIAPEEVIFCGTPEQYEEAIVSSETGRRLRA